jgi:dynamin 1-like protein
MEALIPIINKLNDVLTATGDWRLKSPTIVTIGMQSSGKSTILENIVGR